MKCIYLSFCALVVSGDGGRDDVIASIPSTMSSSVGYPMLPSHNSVHEKTASQSQVYSNYQTSKLNVPKNNPRPKSTLRRENLTKGQSVGSEDDHEDDEDDKTNEDNDLSAEKFNSPKTRRHSISTPSEHSKSAMHNGHSKSTMQNGHSKSAMQNGHSKSAMQKSQDKFDEELEVEYEEEREKLSGRRKDPRAPLKRSPKNTSLNSFVPEGRNKRKTSAPKKTARKVSKRGGKMGIQRLYDVCDEYDAKILVNALIDAFDIVSTTLTLNE